MLEGDHAKSGERFSEVRGKIPLFSIFETWSGAGLGQNLVVQASFLNGTRDDFV